MLKKDFTQVAFNVVQQATGEKGKSGPETERQKNSRKGGLKGGAKRMAELSKEERSELAKKAAKARWQK